MRHESTSAGMLAVLRRHLRQEGWTSARLAHDLAIGEATAKRWLAGKGLTLDRLERLAALAGLTIADLAREAEEAPQGLAHELTLAQERALSTDIFLSFLFMAILGGIQPDEVMADFALPPRMMEIALLKLERLALIDRLRSGRARALVDRALVFRKTPLRALFEHQMKYSFFELDYAALETHYAAEVVKLSDVGAAQLAELIEKFRGEVQALSDRDRETTLLPRTWYGVLGVMRDLDLSSVRDAGWQAGS
ncbi:helix-turn-helix transcriptional regulator [Sphingobium aromaticiconvertens]|uniref:helix-turn-helix domain-containing protein n=1 Tax=Sphingobium aromaticiconvertens TaxID=365341 RepID=UPI003019F1CE